MKRNKEIHQFDKSFEKQVFEALKFYGFKLPKTQEQIDEYVRMFGSTRIELPDSLKDAGAIFDSITKNETLSDQSNGVWAMAARGDNGTPLPESIINQIKEDIKNGKWLKNDVNDNKRRRN